MGVLSISSLCPCVLTRKVTKHVIHGSIVSIDLTRIQLLRHGRLLLIAAILVTHSLSSKCELSLKALIFKKYPISLSLARGEHALEICYLFLKYSFVLFISLHEGQLVLQLLLLLLEKLLFSLELDCPLFDLSLESLPFFFEEIALSFQDF